MRVASARNSIMGGGSNIEGESLSCQLHFRRALKTTTTTKNAYAQGSIKFIEISNSFWEGTTREKTRLKKVSYLLTWSVSQSDQNMYFYMWLYCAFYTFLEVRIMHIDLQVRRGVDFSCNISFGCTPSGSRCGS